MLTRRAFVLASGAASLLPSAVRAQVRADPFTLGIASGSPRETSVILWTRLAPDPLRGGGMPPADVPVRYRIWADAEKRRLVREGDVPARADEGHSIHLLVEGLQAGREYWYQFAVADFESVLGRTRTASRRDGKIRLAVASCQSWQSGYFNAFADMAAWAPDCVIHVGDYIYEGGISPLGERTVVDGAGDSRMVRTVRQHNSSEIVSLWDYRNRYALYNSDPALQAARAASPWIMAMDDHEIDNNWASDTPQDPEQQTPLEWKVRKLAAFQAYYEHMPIAKPPIITGIESSLRMHGVYRFGPAQVHLLDTRQFRADQVCGDGFPGQLPCPDATRPDRSMLGPQQEEWLAATLKASDARYNVLASQTWISPYRYNKAPEPAAVNFDSWDGYSVARQRLLDLLGGVTNPVAISGDWHCAAAMTMHAEPLNARSRRIGHEFAGTSIASECPWAGAMERSRADNPHVRHYNGRQRGYCRFDVDGKHWTTSYRVVADQYDPASPVSTEIEMRTADL